MKALTIRLPDAVYDDTRELAKERRQSMNEFIASCVQQALLIREEQRLYEAFTLVGEDREESSVEFAIPAQQEVVRDDA